MRRFAWKKAILIFTLMCAGEFLFEAQNSFAQLFSPAFLPLQPSNYFLKIERQTVPRLAKKSENIRPNQTVALGGYLEYRNWRRIQTSA